MVTEKIPKKVSEENLVDLYKKFSELSLAFINLKAEVENIVNNEFSEVSSKIAKNREIISGLDVSFSSTIIGLEGLILTLLESKTIDAEKFEAKKKEAVEMLNEQYEKALAEVRNNSEQ